MKKLTVYAIYGALILMFLISIILIHQSAERNLKADLKYHSNALSSYLWEMDYNSGAQYLSLAMDERKYISATINDYSSLERVLSVEKSLSSKLDILLHRMKIISVKEDTQIISWQGRQIGDLSVRYYNRNIYKYSYAFLGLLISLFIVYLIIRLVRSQEWLESMVQKRTSELEQEVLHRQSVEDDLKMTLNSIDDGLISTDEKSNIIRMNPVAEKMTGWQEKDAQHKPLVQVFRMITFEKEDEKIDPVSMILHEGKINKKVSQGILTSKSNDSYHIDVSGAPLQDEHGNLKGTVLVFRDITEEVKLRNQLEHSHRMDAIGQLAGGVAHDFNNMLGGIIGSAEILRNRIMGDEASEHIVDLIIETSERASFLTGKLLAFSRKKKILSTDFDLHQILQDSISLLSRSIDKTIEIETQMKAEHFFIAGDPTMIQNSIINMGINASHAMPEGGILHLATRNLTLDEHYCSKSSFDLEPGHFIELIVEDNGTGISSDSIPHIFEPFFTTKGLGKGTGLGLSTVYGAVNQHHGEIKVYSELGRGTSFHILLPLSNHNEERMHIQSNIVEKGSGTILVVDDEKIMRFTAQGILEDLGYRILQAKDGLDALNVYKEHKDEINLVLLDMVMPNMNGRKCFEKLREQNPLLPIILSSGFTNSEDIIQMKNNDLTGFISKPYRAYELGILVKKTLVPD